MPSTPFKRAFTGKNGSGSHYPPSMLLASWQPPTQRLLFTMPATSTMKTHRSHTDKNANTPVRHTPTLQDPFQMPLITRQPTLPLQTPVNLESSVVFSTLSSTPTVKKCQTTQKVPQEKVQLMWDEYQAKQEECAEKKKVEEEDQRRKLKKACIDTVMQAVKKAGFPMFHDFLDDVLTAEDPIQSSHISQLIINHGSHLFDLMRQRQRNITNDWIITGHQELLQVQCEALALHFQLQQGASVMEILAGFSIKGFLSQAEDVAPLVCDVLKQIGYPGNITMSRYKDRELILSAVLCMLAKSRNEHATEFQTTMGMYFLASGTSKALFDALNHAGFTLSYTQSIHKLKRLGEERLEQT
ncbi:hypothetical protein BDN70DRAFT_936502 [Pholiota conissans]|uniref:Uncharacterized protein n=1 Tax=Pholiota conissans TaxID=109636 RepID=A0A9P6CQ35_9AGAR|nr:hypothetical protein BDN70DRAFT_936502 [Pholiota conissans]